MKAVVYHRHGDENVLDIDDVPTPELGAGEVRIAARTAGVNRADLLQRRGLYPPPPGASPILGLECAGTVVEVGEDVGGFRIGDRVMALLAGGGYAEQVVVDARCAMMVPSGLDDAAAGGFPETFLTAFLNMYLLGGLGPGDAVLIHGGSGGVERRRHRRHGPDCPDRRGSIISRLYKTRDLPELKTFGHRPSG